MSTNPDSSQTNDATATEAGNSRLVEIQGQPSRLRSRSIMIERARILSRRIQGGRI